LPVKKEAEKSKHSYISEQYACAVDLHRLSLNSRIYKLLPSHAPDITNSKAYVFLEFYFKNGHGKFLILERHQPIAF